MRKPGGYVDVRTCQFVALFSFDIVTPAYELWWWMAYIAMAPSAMRKTQFAFSSTDLNSDFLAAAAAMVWMTSP